MIAALLGLGWGFVADRLAARWPIHDDGHVRRIDWRTPIVSIVGAAAAYFLVVRFGNDGRAFGVLAVYVVALVLLFATDLDQRLLPDVVTLPLIVFALLAFASGTGPFVKSTSDLGWAIGAAIAVPVGLFALSIPFGAGAIGMGDLKLLVSVGLLGGAARLVTGLVLGAVLAAVVIVALLAVRRITLHTYIPYGPFLILGALWAILRSTF